VERPRIIADRDIARLTTGALSGVFDVHRAFDLEKNEQLIGAMRGPCGLPRHDERRALTAHQDRLRHGIGAGGEGETRLLRGVRERHRVEVGQGFAKRLPEPRTEMALGIAVQPLQLGR
jgi:hypothetical protein